MRSSKGGKCESVVNVLFAYADEHVGISRLATQAGEEEGFWNIKYCPVPELLRAEENTEAFDLR